MNRRDFLRLMLATAAAESVDFEKLLWTPKPIITVPAIPVNSGRFVAATWMKSGLYVPVLFDKDDEMFQRLMKGDLTPMIGRKVTVPLNIIPGAATRSVLK